MSPGPGPAEPTGGVDWLGIWIVVFMSLSFMNFTVWFRQDTAFYLLLASILLAILRVGRGRVA